MAAGAPAESVMALALSEYESALQSRAEGVLATKGLAIDEVDSVVAQFPLSVSPRTEAAVNDYLSENGILDHDEQTDTVVERVYQHGIRLHGLLIALGKSGIQLGSLDVNGNKHVHVVMVADNSPRQSVPTFSLLGELMNSVQQGLDEKEATVIETAELLGKSPDSNVVSRRRVGLLAVHAAALEQQVEASGLTTTDLVNLGGQLYCILATIQKAGAQRLFLKDKDDYALPLPEDLNGLALTDNPHWVEECGPIAQLT